MPKPYTFLPENGTSTRLILYWIISIIVGAIPLLKQHNQPHLLISAILFVAALALSVFNYKQPINITIIPEERNLIYLYVNCWGQERNIVINLNHSRGYYDYEKSTNLTGGWRLVLYSDWNFYNRLSIKENDGKGYYKEQLDKIAALVHST